MSYFYTRNIQQMIKWIHPKTSIIYVKLNQNIKHLTFNSGWKASWDSLERILRTDSTCRMLSLCSLPVIVDIFFNKVLFYYNRKSSSLQVLGLGFSEPINWPLNSSLLTPSESRKHKFLFNAREILPQARFWKICSFLYHRDERPQKTYIY